MKNKLFYPLVVLFTLLSLCVWSQTDSLKVEKPNGYLLYSSLGGGFNNRGANGGISLTMTSADGLGGSINLMTGYVKLENIPSDYYSFFFRWTPPVNDFTILSFNLVKKFTTPNGLFRFGMETGPSWFRYNQTTIELNPGWPDLFQYKYNKYFTLKNTFGWSAAVKAEFPFLSFLGLDISIFANFNGVQSVGGMDICLELGKVGGKTVTKSH
jgi:hypothetical protein